MMGSLRRITAVAGNTFLEAVRQKVFAVLLVFALALIYGANYFTEFSFQEQFKFLKDLGYASISLTGLLVGLLGASQLIPGEIERRTILTALCRPLRRWEFIAGKYLGLATLLAVMVAIMAIAVGGVLGWKEAQLIAREGSDPAVAAAIQKEARDPRLLQAVLLVEMKVAVVAAVAREQWLESGEVASWVAKAFLAVVAFLVPDFNLYNLIDEIIAGNAVSWRSTLEVTGYSAVYIAVLLTAASVLFEGRDI